jgi:hypothetical protein
VLSGGLCSLALLLMAAPPRTRTESTTAPGIVSASACGLMEERERKKAEVEVGEREKETDKITKTRMTS